jgi:iron complex outermembrane recepter protein
MGYKTSLRAFVLATSLSAIVFASSNDIYTIASMPLKKAIEKISDQAGLPYLVDAKLLENKGNAPAISNVEGLQKALDTILKKSGLKAKVKNGTIMIEERKENEPTELEGISISASQEEGTAEEGYLVEKTKTLGVWGNLSLQDTPYSMSVMSSDFLENTITSNMGQVAKQNSVLQSNGNASYNGELGNSIRGFAIGSALIDGIPIPSSNFGVGLKEVERVEIISGLNGFLYGVGNVGGTINYTLKYPTATPFTNVSIGNNGGENYYTSVDSSQKINDKLSVRVNANYQDGDTAKDNNSNEEKLIAVSFDYKPTDDLQLQLYASHRESHINGVTPLWVITGKMPDAFDTSKSYSPDWSYNNVDSDKVELKANYNFSENLKLRTAYIYKEADRLAHWFINRFNANTGTFSRNYWDMGKETTTNHGAYAYLDGEFNTGYIQHNLTFGGSLGTAKVKGGDVIGTWDSDTYTNNSDLMTWNVANALSADNYLKQKYNNKNIVLGDNITFNEQWSALIGANLASMENKNGQGIIQYDESEITPTFSLIYKPIKDLTTYITYMESLQNGDVVDNPADTNDGKVFKPLVSKQYEIGAKYAINQDLLLSTALFRIEKANNMTETFADSGNGKTQTTTQDGLQVNQGIEVLVTGKATDSLTLQGGLTYLSPKIEKTEDKTLEGKEATEVAKYQAKIYAEYRLPVMPKIYVNGGIYYTGTQWMDSANTEELPDYTTVDLGVRYETKIDGYNTTFRIYATNITGEDYWASSNMLSENPRSIAFNVTMKF